MRVHLALGVFTLALLFGLAACAPAPSPLLSTAWEYNQLRALDAPEASQPTLDLLAVYARDSGEQIQIRLDLLDLASLPDFDLYLALDYRQGGSTSLPLQETASLAWDRLLVIPARGSIQVLDDHFQPTPRSSLVVLRDPILDTITISVERESLNNAPKTLTTNLGLRFQVFLTPAGSDQPADILGPVSSDATPPAPAPVLYAFWNSYPAYTPLTALRRWAGAHTGPGGGSHGLQYLLQAARATDTPLLLLDLKNPAWLSALDYGNNLAIVDEMLAAGMLILPEYTPDASYSPFPPNDQATGTIQAQNRPIASRFSLPTSPFVFTPWESLSAPEKALFIFTLYHPAADETPLLKPTPIFRWSGQRLLAIPDNIDRSSQATLDGPSLEVKRSLAETALAANRYHSGSAPPLVLGGELPASLWGDPLTARRSFIYLARHPWVRPLDAHDILTAKANPGASISSAILPAAHVEADFSLLTALQNEPFNALNAAAWQAFAALSAPVYPVSEDLPALRANYTGNVWSLLAAAKWAETPTRLSTCAQDPDHDGQNECILASENYYTQFEIESGALTHAFAVLADGVDGGNPHQWIAPSSQFISGLSDPLFWKLDGGTSADPSVINGAFAEPGMDYRANTAGDCLIFTSSNEEVRKAFCLYAGGLDVEYRFSSHPPFPNLQIPLALDPWRRFASDWADAYQAIRLPNGWSWGLYAGPQVQILTTARLNVETFLDSRSFFNRAEDPNIDYPPGHGLPFPLALVEIPVQGNLNVQLEVQPANQ
jgi:hypothetical protein